MNRCDRLYLALIPLLIVSYCAVQWYFYLVLPGQVPDEIVFTGRIGEMAKTNLLEQPNDLGYGAVYWWLYRLLGVAFNFNFLAYRAFSLALAVSIPIAIACVPARPAPRLFGVLLYLTFPMAWWYGKVIGPELLNTACIAWALCLALRQQWGVGAFLLALGVGVKPNAAPTALAFGAVWCGYALRELSIPRLRRGKSVFLYNVTSLIPSLFAIAIAAALGFLAANPFMIWHFQEYRASFIGNSGVITAERALDMLVGQTWEWDVVFAGGLMYWTVHWAAIIPLLFATLLGAPIELFLGLFATLGATLYLLLSVPRFLGWYWFPVIPSIAMLAASIRNHVRITVPLLALATALNAVSQSDFIADLVWHRLKLAELLEAQPTINTCLVDKIGDRRFPILFNGADAWIGFDLPNVGTAQKKNLLDLVNAMKSPEDTKALLATNESTLLLVGDRVTRHRSFPIIDQGGFNHEGMCGSIAVYTRTSAR